MRCAAEERSGPSPAVPVAIGPPLHIVHQSVPLAGLGSKRVGHAIAKAKSTAGWRPVMMLARALAEPQAMVHPNVPCPVLRNKLDRRVRPTTGTLLGVAGRNPAQGCAGQQSRASGH